MRAPSQTSPSLKSDHMNTEGPLPDEASTSNFH